MKLSSQIQPLSHLKANAAEILQKLARDQQPLVITQNGKAAAVLQDLASYEQTQETMALLKILALGNTQVESGRVKPLVKAIAQVRRRTQNAAA
jgi:prevent-host-death family protein